MTADRDRWVPIMMLIAAPDGAELTGSGLCAASAELLGVDGAAIALMTGKGVPVATYRSDPAFQPIEDLQLVLGVGPCLDAYRERRPVVEADLATGSTLRWPGLAPLALDAGIRSISAFPLRIGAARFGALTAYDSRPGALEGSRLDDALALSAIVTRTLVAMQLDGAAGDLVPGLSRASLVGDNLPPARLPSGEIDHAEVHQASGMVSVQLGIDVGDALARLRARAFADGTTVREVAAEVVARRLRFDP